MGIGVLAVIVGVAWIVMWPAPPGWDRAKAALDDRRAQGYRVSVPLEQLVWLRSTRLRSTIWGLIQIAFGVGLLLLAKNV